MILDPPSSRLKLRSVTNVRVCISGNGTIEFAEFVKMMSSKTSDAYDRNLDKEAFDVFDIDGTGFITFESRFVYVHSCGSWYTLCSLSYRVSLLVTRTDVKVGAFFNVLFHRTINCKTLLRATLLTLFVYTSDNFKQEHVLCLNIDYLLRLSKLLSILLLKCKETDRTECHIGLQIC